MNNDWYIKIRECMNRFGVEIFVYRRAPNGSGTEVMGPNDTATIYEYGKDFPPTLYLPLDAFKALKDEFFKDFRGPDHNFLEGENKAMKNHMADLRKLLKLPKSI